jgi:hypothetical protein
MIADRAGFAKTGSFSGAALCAAICCLKVGVLFRNAGAGRRRRENHFLHCFILQQAALFHWQNIFTPTFARRRRSVT